MGLDVRIPITILFAILGCIIVLLGVVMPAEIYSKSLNMNINLIWGGVMLVFSLLMFLWIWWDKKNAGKVG
jgi:hypothetical protein